MLENTEEGNLLRSLHDLLVHRVEHVQVGIDVDSVRAVGLEEMNMFELATF